jgi:flavin-dependent dehydrogenase
MEACDVLVVGGGPAGSSCAWKLRQAGLDVIVVDQARFPRDKVCAGWITPQVIAELDLDVDDYRRGRTFQPITGFRTGVIGGRGPVTTVYDSPVSFGIRRCEFDHYLLQRSNARLKLGMGISSIRRDAAGSHWVVNDAVRAPMLVGAGGHFCPVARRLNPTIDDASLVVAQEVEVPIDSDGAASSTVEPEVPELYFCPDLKGYGWCFRKQHYLNIGLGRRDRRSLPKATARFLAFLRSRHTLAADASWRWRGHAYLVSEPQRRRVLDAGVMLVGDAAGLAYPQSGEGIRPAIESGLLAASTIVDAGGDYSRKRIEPYGTELRERFGAHPVAQVLSRAIVPGLAETLLPPLLDTPWLVRHLLLDRWFLHAHEPPLLRGGASTLVSA